VTFLGQALANGVLATAAYVVLALSFALILQPTRFFNFAHAVVFAAGAYGAYLVKERFGWGLGAGIVGGVAAATVVGCLTDLGVYRPLRRRGASPLVMLLASLGIYVVLQNLISLAFGDDTKSIRSGEVREGLNILGARLTPIQLITIGVAVAIVFAVWALLRYTRLGRALRAVAANPDLARVNGIDADRAILAAFAIGSALAGLAGILVALDVDMTPTMGMAAFMPAVVAVIVGGVGSVPGVALGALLIGLAQHLGVWKISSQWQDAIVFIVLLVFLLARPQGFLGKRIKRVEV